MKHQAKLLLVGLMSITSVRLPAQQATPQASGGAAPVFRSETRLVPVDVVVTDKKQSYIHDLEMKDFKVWEATPAEGWNAKRGEVIAGLKK